MQHNNTANDFIEYWSLKQDKFTQEAKLLRSAWCWDTVMGEKYEMGGKKYFFMILLYTLECFCIPSQKVFFPLETPPTYYYFQRKRFASEGKVYQETYKFQTFKYTIWVFTQISFETSKH